MGRSRTKNRYQLLINPNYTEKTMARVARKILNLLVRLLHLLMYPIILLINIKKGKTVPPITNPLLMISATKLAQKIRNKEVKCEDVISAFIDRCKEVNPIVNAIVEPRYEMALSEAKNVDELVASGVHSIEDLERLYPLLGLPITIKESIAVEGMSNQAGRFRPKRISAKNDAECITLVKAAGAIPLLVSNTPELCMCWETYNYVTGLTKNPHDTSRTCGGSSGGEVALIASGASVFGIGSDIAGSLRLPAMYTGIFGHKPSARAVSVVGHYPNCEAKQWKDVFALGPMARHSEDLPLLLSVMNDPNGCKIRPFKKVPITDMKFYYMEGDDTGATNKIDSDIRDAMKKVISYFEDQYGITVKKTNIESLKYSFEASILKIIRLDGVETIFSKPGNPSKWTSVNLEMLKKVFGCSKSIMIAIIYGYLKKIFRLFSDDTYEKSEKLIRMLRNEFTNLLQDNGVCFYPTFPRTASYHYEFFGFILDYAYLFIFNVLGLPATNCPVGVTSKGLPVGIQIIANHGCDHLTLGVAKELEKAFGGWTKPAIR